MSIHTEGAQFDVICKRCNTKMNVTRNWGGGIRQTNRPFANPAICKNCESRQLEIF